ncbi:DUF2231 domain-containing protein [Williamsia soli]|uniref:DUF2231 domain-containing protein n=1 Tax=Williamsia soli TaxID=364929 RepID=UPI001A9F0C7A|nr:DUF2231 domain-containing protein [Williamsia soli]
MTTPPNSADGPMVENATEHEPSAAPDASTNDPARLPARALLSAEKLSFVDSPADNLAILLERAIPSAASKFLRGHWLGHPLHPIMVTVPIGAWMSVPVLDLTGQSTAARRLLAFGIAAAVPASVTGLVEYTTLDIPQRRVAVVHVAANTVGISCFAQSWWRRRRSSGIAGLAWTVAGLMVAGLGGALGGHLSYAQGAGVLRER